MRIRDGFNPKEIDMTDENELYSRIDSQKMANALSLNSLETLMPEEVNYDSTQFQQLTEGFLLGEHKNYRLIKKLGEGGMGQTWLAMKIAGGKDVQQVVCKILSDKLRQNPGAMAEIHRTFLLTQGLNHRGICPMLGIETDPRFGDFLTMKYAEGGTLWESVRSCPGWENGLSLESLLPIFRPLAEALDYAHRAGVIHRDIKPQNIMFMRSGQSFLPVLIDFGIAARIHPNAVPSGGMTFSREDLMSHSSSGTPLYMAPEQMEGSPQDGRTDQYSFAAVLYEILTGNLPFSGKNVVKIGFEKLRFRPVLPHFSKQINDAFTRALSVNPADRYPTCSEFIHALENGLNSAPQNTPEANTQSNSKNFRSVSRAASKFPAASQRKSAAKSVSSENANAKEKSKAESKRQNTVSGQTEISISSDNTEFVMTFSEGTQVIDSTEVRTDPWLESIQKKASELEKTSKTVHPNPQQSVKDILTEKPAPEDQNVKPSFLNKPEGWHFPKFRFMVCDVLLVILIIFLYLACQPKYADSGKTFIHPPFFCRGHYSIPEGVTAIGPQAFLGAKLTSVSIPEGVTLIDKEAFAGSSIKSVVLPNSLTTIKEKAFSHCSSLYSVKFSPSQFAVPRLHTIGTLAFQNCSSLLSINFPETLNTISISAFQGCSALTSVKLPRNLEIMEEHAFNDCSSLTSITFPENLEVIPAFAFYGCSSLSSLKIPNKTKKISLRAFAYCSNLMSVEIPASVKHIEDEAFRDCLNLMRVEISGKDVRLGKYVFKGCEKLPLRKEEGPTILNPVSKTDFDSPEKSEKKKGKEPENDSVSKSESEKLENESVSKSESEKLENESVSKSDPEKLEEILKKNYKYSRTGDSIHIQKYIGSETEVRIPEGVASIGIFAFEKCYRVRSITLPKSLEKHGFSYYFCDCLNLTEILADEANPYFKSIDGVLFTKDGKTLLCYPQAKGTRYEVPDGTEIIGESAFQYCKKLESVILPATLQKIEAWAFGGCEALRSISIPKGIKEISERTFSSCRNLESVEIPDSVLTIGEEAFYFCDKLKSVEIPDSVLTIGEKAFLFCNKLKSVEIPDSVTEIKEYAFGNCEQLEFVSLPGSLAGIPSHAFADCSNLRKVVIAEGVVVIEDSAFRNSRLRSVTIPASVKEIEFSAFGVTNQLTIYAPEFSEAHIFAEKHGIKFQAIPPK